MLRNVVIDLGNNPGLSGVSMSGAQLCSIEDVTVTGTDFTAGVVGLPGSGGFTANLRVDGGAFAVWQAQFRPNPSVSGLVALNQSVAAVLLQKTRGPSSTTTILGRFRVALPHSNGTFCVFKPSAQTHTVAPRYGSHRHQLRVFL